MTFNCSLFLNHIAQLANNGKNDFLKEKPTKENEN